MTASASVLKKHFPYRKKLLQQKSLRYICIIAMVVFALLLITSIFLFYM